MFGTAVEQLESAVDRIAELISSVEDTDVPVSEAAETVLRLERSRERFEAAIGGFLTDLDARGLPQRDGAYSMANWLATRTGQRRATAGSRMHLARRLREMPLTAEALAAGEITSSHGQVLTRARNPRTERDFARDEAMLVASAKKLTAEQLAKVVEFWLRHADPDGAAPRDGEDRFFLSQTLHGRLKGDFDLGGDLAIRVKATIDELVSQLLAEDNKARETDPMDPRVEETAAQRRARALGRLCERAAASADNPARRQPLITLHTTIETLAETGNPADWTLELEEAWSSVIPVDTAQLWSCDCWIANIVIRKTNGEVLDAGRQIRYANRAMRRALVARDGACCAVPGCDRPVGWCDAHHILWWEHGGETKLDNLVFLCRWHHMRIHDGHLYVTMVDGRPQFTNRAGMILLEPRSDMEPRAPDHPPDSLAPASTREDQDGSGSRHPPKVSAA